MKTIKFLGQSTATVFLVALFSVFASAQSSSPQEGVNSTSNNLNMSATVQRTVQLSITAGSDSEASGTYALDFGTVDARGIANAKGYKATAIGDGTNYSALYKKQITLLPAFSGFGPGETPEIVMGINGDAEGLVREGSSVGIGDSATSGATISTVASGAPINREVGFKISRTTLAGVYTPTLTYTLTVNP